MKLADFYYAAYTWADVPEYWAGVAEAERQAARWKGLSPNDVDTTALADAKRGAEAYDRGDHDTAIRHYTAAIVSGTLSESLLANAYYYRGKAWVEKGDPDRAVSDYNQVIAINPKHIGAFNKLAWLYATQRDPAYRNGNLAVRFAEELLQKLGEKIYPLFIDTVAAAYARGGDFSRAIRYQEQAIELAKEDREYEKEADLASYQERLQLYRSGRAYTATD